MVRSGLGLSRLLSGAPVYRECAYVYVCIMYVYVCMYVCMNGPPHEAFHVFCFGREGQASQLISKERPGGGE